jgi:hypothetical protein
VAVAALNHSRDADGLLEVRIRHTGRRIAGAIARSPVFADDEARGDGGAST